MYSAFVVLVYLTKNKFLNLMLMDICEKSIYLASNFGKIGSKYNQDRIKADITSMLSVGRRSIKRVMKALGGRGYMMRKSWYRRLFFFLFPDFYVDRVYSHFFILPDRE